MEKVKLAVIGLGQRGYGLLTAVLLNLPDVEVVGVCDLYEDRVEDAAKAVEEKGFSRPFTTTDYHQILSHSEVQAVVISTAWEYHAEIAIAAMKAGKATALEVGGAYAIEELWEMVRTYEATKTPFMFMENCCYDRCELLGTAMERAGLFGEIVHCAGAYAHDLREEVVSGEKNRHYRLRNYTHRNAENYPTHELGPIAKLLNINRGNRMVSLVSVASKARGLHDYIVSNPDKVDQKLADVQFSQGDVVHTIITCANGETILLKLDTTLPRFYARDFTIRGTKGFYEQNTDTVFIEGVHPDVFAPTAETLTNMFTNAKTYEDRFLPDCWKHITKEQLESGHGGMDYFEFRAFIDALKNGEEMPIDVYDAAAWMAITPLTEASIREGGHPQSIPDFTCGKWLVREPKDVIDFK